MYQIEIKKHETVLVEGEKFSTKHLIFAAINSQPKDGLGDDEIGTRQSIRESVSELKDNPILLLEDAEFKVLLNCINDMRDKKATGWQFQDAMIKPFCDEMRGLKSFKPAKLTEASENGQKETELVK